MPALRDFLQVSGGVDLYKNLRVKYTQGAEPTLNVEGRSIDLRPYIETTETIHQFLQVEQFVTQDLRDGHKDCPDWAFKGSCYTNAAYMLTTCPKSCNDINPDMHNECFMWANRGECVSNAVFMAEFCSTSCVQTVKNEL